MPRARPGPPSANDIRCPSCRSIDWRRLGERIVELTGDPQRPHVTHQLVDEDGAWHWTCEACAYRVKGGTRLDYQLSVVQARGTVGVAVGFGDRV